MGRTIWVALVTLALGACAAGRTPPAAYPDRALWNEQDRASHSVGHDVLNIIGTPFYALAKGVTCVTTVVVATPVAIGYGLGERPDRALVRAELDRGVGANCGGSYMLGAY
jgi:hypothetical protein